MRKRHEEFSIKDLLDIFLPKLWLIVIVSMVFAFCMAFYSSVMKEDTYTSTTRIHISKNASGSSDLGVSDVEFATFYLQTYIELIKIPDFLVKVVDDFRTTSDYNEYLKRNGGRDTLSGASIRGYISTSTVQDILSVSVTTTDPYLSHGLANSIQNVICNSDEQVLAYPKEIVTPLTIQVPTHPTSPNSRKLVLNTGIGAVAGAGISMVLIFILNIMDVTIHDKKKLEDNFDIPILGVIPRFITEEGKSKK